jgi:hypothetical protein
MKTKLLFVLGAILSFQTAHAQVEIHSKVSPGYIRVSRDEHNDYGFQLCRDGDQGGCSQIGNRPYYSVDELNYRSQRLKHEGYILIADDSGWLILGTAVAAAGVAFSSNPVTAPLVVVVAGSTAIGSMLGILHGWFTPGNNNTPIKRFHEANSINAVNFSQGNPPTLNIPIEDYASRLNLALNDMY